MLGLNNCMNSLALCLPTIKAIISYLRAGMVLAKDDFCHGFHHMVMYPDDCHYMGFCLPYGCITRIKGMPFSSSQAPALFYHTSSEFLRLLVTRI